jgi:hypothetical protein
MVDVREPGGVRPASDGSQAVIMTGVGGRDRRPGTADGPRRTRPFPFVDHRVAGSRRGGPTGGAAAGVSGRGGGARAVAYLGSAASAAVAAARQASSGGAPSSTAIVTT